MRRCCFRAFENALRRREPLETLGPVAAAATKMGNTKKGRAKYLSSVCATVTMFQNKTIRKYETHRKNLDKEHELQPGLVQAAVPRTLMC